MPGKTKENLKKSNYKKRTNKSYKEKIEKNTKDEKFNFDEEIVIGLRRIDDNPKIENKINKSTKNSKPKSKKKNVKSKDSVIKSKNISDYVEGSKQNNNRKKIFTQKQKKQTKKKERANKKRKLILKIIKWLTLIGIIIAGIIYAMLSPIFNIETINVVGNSKISSEEVISLSGLHIEQNIFNYRTSNVEEGIKQNAYIDKVEVKRIIPNKVEISVIEREATYKLRLGNAYVYINNQGYILEITNKKGDIPLIVGYETQEENLQENNRLSTNDLEKLSDILKIMEAASSMEENIKELITQIDISNQSNYILTLEKEKKRIYLGDATNLSTKMLWIDKFLDLEKKNEGTIYLNINLNTKEPYFNEKI